MQSLEAPLPQWSGRQAEALRLKLAMRSSSPVQVCAEAGVYLEPALLMVAMLHHIPMERCFLIALVSCISLNKVHCAVLCCAALGLRGCYAKGGSNSHMLLASMASVFLWLPVP